MLRSASAVLTSAAYTHFYFNSSRSCPGLGFKCPPPLYMCAYDNLNEKFYCCSGLSYNLCRVDAPTCDGRDGGSGAAQQKCTFQSASWCCVNGSERCISREGLVNVCVAAQDNPISAVSSLLMSETFQSLSSANPGATTYSVDVASLASRVDPFPVVETSVFFPSSSSSSPAPSSSTHAATSPAAADPDAGSAPAGAIAGGVVGGVAVLALGTGTIWFFCVRTRAKSPPAGRHHEGPRWATDADKNAVGLASPGAGFGGPTTRAEMEGERELRVMEGRRGIREMDSERELQEMDDAGAACAEEGKKLMAGGEVGDSPAGRDGRSEL